MQFIFASNVEISMQPGLWPEVVLRTLNTMVDLRMKLSKFHMNVSIRVVFNPYVNHRGAIDSKHDS